MPVVAHDLLSHHSIPDFDQATRVASHQGRRALDTLLNSFLSKTTRQLHVFRLNGHTLGVDGTEQHVGEQASQMGLGRLLEGAERGRLEAQVCLVMLSDLADEPLDGPFTNQQFCRSLWVHRVNCADCIICLNVVSGSVPDTDESPAEPPCLAGIVAVSSLSLGDISYLPDLTVTSQTETADLPIFCPRVIRGVSMSCWEAGNEAFCRPRLGVPVHEFSICTRVVGGRLTVCLTRTIVLTEVVTVLSARKDWVDERRTYIPIASDASSSVANDPYLTAGRDVAEE